jgi:hypothetical protein
MAATVVPLVAGVLMAVLGGKALLITGIALQTFGLIGVCFLYSRYSEACEQIAASVHWFKGSSAYAIDPNDPINNGNFYNADEAERHIERIVRSDSFENAPMDGRCDPRVRKKRALIALVNFMKCVNKTLKEAGKTPRYESLFVSSLAQKDFLTAILTRRGVDEELSRLIEARQQPKVREEELEEEEKAGALPVLERQAYGAPFARKNNKPKRSVEFGLDHRVQISAAPIEIPEE